MELGKDTWTHVRFVPPWEGAGIAVFMVIKEKGEFSQREGQGMETLGARRTLGTLGDCSIFSGVKTTGTFFI